MNRHTLQSPARVSAALWSAALAGLAGGVACGTTDTPTDDTDDAVETDETDGGETDESDDTETEGILSSERVPELNFATFSADCVTRGGIVQIHATCAGNNACAGMSFNKWSKDLTEHTCRGLNSCGGASCVVLQADQGRDPAELYDQYCGSMCHGEDFSLYVAPTMTPEDGEARFNTRSTETHMALIAFGATGMTPDGTPFANMPPFKDKFSRAELAGLVAFVKTLDVEVTTYGVPGETEDFTDL